MPLEQKETAEVAAAAVDAQDDDSSSSSNRTLTAFLVIWASAVEI